MVYLKQFSTHSEYDNYINGSDAILPNISICEDTPNEVHYNPYVIDSYNGHEYVEIGGLKWATMNVGANNITDTGLYFQWGDKSGYAASQVGSVGGEKYFEWADYKYGNGTSAPGPTGMSKYNNTDHLTTLDASDDAATVNMGSGWRMPTTEEYVALGNAVNTTWTTNYQGSGISGLICTDKTNSSKILFFPACGCCYKGTVNNAGRYGFYWSSSIGINSVQAAFEWFFDYNGRVVWQFDDHRDYGFSVRGVVG